MQDTTWQPELADLQMVVLEIIWKKSYLLLLREVSDYDSRGSDRDLGGLTQNSVFPSQSMLRQPSDASRSARTDPPGSRNSQNPYVLGRGMLAVLSLIEQRLLSLQIP